jgi:hypothetical protein
MAIVLDRSTSMNQPFGAYSQLVTALNTVTAYVSDFSVNPGQKDRPSIQFSFIAFPDTDPNSCQPQMGCCASSAQDWGTFNNKLNGCATLPGSCASSANRPISDALSTAQAAVDSGGPPSSNSPRHVVLITDGSPTGNCAVPPMNDCSAAVSVAGLLPGDGVKFSVIGLGDQSMLGGCLASLPASHYPALTDMDLVTALQQITSAAVCNGTLTNVPPSSSSLQVSLGVFPYAQGSQDGWSYDSNTGRLHMYGMMCDNYASGQGGHLQVLATCPHGP